MAERPLAEHGAVKAFEYRCTASRGDRPAAEAFARPSIAIVRAGVFGFRRERRARLLTEGFVLIGNPGEEYEVSHEHAGGDRCLVFSFDERAVEEATGKRRFGRSVLPPLPRIDALRQLAEDRACSSLGLEEIGLALATCVAQASSEVTPKADVVSDDRRARGLVRAAIDRIGRSLGDELKLQQLADDAGLSAYHFLRVFQRETGETPHRFLVRARIRRAVDLLRDTRRSVTDIALDVGFGDLSNFIHTFRRELGRSPRSFRKDGPKV